MNVYNDLIWHLACVTRRNVVLFQKCFAFSHQTGFACKTLVFDLAFVV